MKITRNVLALVAVLFGLITIIVGTRVLLGSDPGYIIYRPLLIYNAVMGIVYVSTGIIALRNVKQAMYLAAVIFALNFVVLTAIYYLYTEGSSIAIDSLRAMTLRTVVWLALFAGFGWLSNRNKLYGFKQDA